MSEQHGIEHRFEAAEGGAVSGLEPPAHVHKGAHLFWACLRRRQETTGEDVLLNAGVAHRQRVGHLSARVELPDGDAKRPHITLLGPWCHACGSSSQDLRWGPADRNDMVD